MMEKIKKSTNQNHIELKIETIFKKCINKKHLKKKDIDDDI